MPRAYTTATVALALGTSGKWVDNVLSHNAVSGVTQRAQGVSRRVSVSGVLELAVAQRIAESLGSPLGRALRSARELLDRGELGVGEDVLLSVDLVALAERVQRQLELAVEIAPVPKRGRPRGKTKRGA
jgi:hypothetical protein